MLKAMNRLSYEINLMSYNNLLKRDDHPLEWGIPPLLINSIKKDLRAHMFYKNSHEFSISGQISYINFWGLQ